MTKPHVTDEMISRMRHDMRIGRIPLERQQITDYEIPRLRAVIYRDGPTKFRFEGNDIQASSIVEARQMVMALISA